MKKTFCILISIILLISIFPAFAFAEGEAAPADEAAPPAVDFTVTTTEPTNITYRSAVVGGIIDNPDGLIVKECGVRYWDGGPNPGPEVLIRNYKFTTIQNGDFSHKFVSWAGDLSPEQMYSYYAYVIYEKPDTSFEINITANGETKSFTTEPNPHGTRTLTDPETGIILTGDYIHKDTTFSTVQINEKVKAACEQQLQAGYHLEFAKGLDMYLAPETEGFPVKGEVFVEIPVGEKYNGQTMRMFAMFFQEFEDEPHIFSGTVSGGYLSVEMEPCFPNIAVEVPDSAPAPTPEPGFEERKIYTRPVGTGGVLIEVVGDLAPGAELKTETIQPNTDAYKKLSEKVENGKTILLSINIDIVTPDGTAPFTGAVKLSFAVGKKYDGQTLRVLHLVDGAVIEHAGVVEGGVLTVPVDRFSPFAVEVPEEAGNQSVDETKKSPKTDDPAMLWLYFVMAGGTTAALVCGAYRKKKA